MGAGESPGVSPAGRETEQQLMTVGPHWTHPTYLSRLTQPEEMVN